MLQIITKKNRCDKQDKHTTLYYVSLRLLNFFRKAG